MHFMMRAGHILLWHYGIGTLEGLCKGHAQDVTQVKHTRRT